jgi:hypothetical protein
MLALSDTTLACAYHCEVLIVVTLKKVWVESDSRLYIDIVVVRCDELHSDELHSDDMCQETQEQA